MDKFITIPVYYSVDDESGVTHYDTDSMRDEFNKRIEELEDLEHNEIEAFNDKMRDYAMDNMTQDNMRYALEIFE